MCSGDRILIQKFVEGLGVVRRQGRSGSSHLKYLEQMWGGMTRGRRTLYVHKERSANLGSGS